MTLIGTITSYDCHTRTGLIAATCGGEVLPFRQSDLSHHFTAPTIGASYGFERRAIGWGSHRAVKLRPTLRDFATMQQVQARQQRG